MSVASSESSKYSMDELKLNYPEVKLENEEESSDEGEDTETAVVLTRVTDLVRQQYLNYVQKLLKRNYEIWCTQANGFAKDPPENWVRYCAQKYEEKAIRSCMIVHLYRKEMLKIIAEIQHETSCGKLVSNLRKYNNYGCELKEKINRNLIDVGTQTDERTETKEFEENLNLSGIHEMRNECLSLQDKIQYLQQKLDEREKRIKEIVKSEDEHKTELKMPLGPLKVNAFPKKLSNVHYPSRNRKRHISHNEQIENEISLPVQDNYAANKKRSIQTTPMQVEDEIAKELENLLGEEKNLEDEIFGDDTHNIQVEKILQEIEKADISNQDGQNDAQQLELSPKLPEKLEKVYEKRDLRDSLWPCELHMQEQKLRDILGDLAEMGIRHYERIKYRFIELFGEDSEDEFIPYSPTIEANEILIESCKKRIAPWIVKYLMIPMNDGLIGNRFLFKKLAKKLANYIIMKNQYPGKLRSRKNFYRSVLQFASVKDWHSVHSDAYKPGL